jgi:uncharacterized protein YjbI with pentapeptide repeats
MEVDTVKPHYRPVNFINQESQKKIVIELEGNISEVNRDWPLFLKLALQTFPGDSIKITGIKPGSIKLFVEGSPEDIEQLISQFNSGEITELSNFPIASIQSLTEDSYKKVSIERKESKELEDKRRLVQEIISEPIKGRILIEADLSGADLSGADLSEANLNGANLSGAYLSGANLSGANLSGADLIVAYLNGADLSGAELISAYLNGADLSETELFGANLSEADLNGANLSGANLSETDLNEADLSEANLSGAYLNEANLSGANLSGAYLFGTNLSGAYLFEANLNGAYLFGANLSGANLSEINVTNSRFGKNQGISSSLKNDLIEEGAMFEDFLGGS